MGCAAGFYDGGEEFLDVAAMAQPLFAGAAQGSDVVEVRVFLRDALEVVAVVELAFVACSVNEPEVLAFAAIFPGVFARFGEKPLGEGAHGSDTGAGGDEDGVGEGFAEGEVAVGSMNLDCAAFGEVAEVVGEETAFDAIDTELKTIALGRRGDGIGARLGLAAGVVGDGGDELARWIWEVCGAVDYEFQVVALGGFGDASFLNEAGSLSFAGQWVLA